MNNDINDADGLTGINVTGINSVFEDIDGESFEASNSVVIASVGWFFN